MPMLSGVRTHHYTAKTLVYMDGWMDVDGGYTVTVVRGARCHKMKTKARQIFEKLRPANLICNSIVFVRITRNELCNDKCRVFFFCPNITSESSFFFASFIFSFAVIFGALIYGPVK